MPYPNDKPSGKYELREDDFAELDEKKIPIDNKTWKNGYKNADESEVESVPDAHEQNWLFDILHRNLRYTQQVSEENKNLLATKVATPTSIGQIKVGYGLDVTSNGVLSVTKGIAEDANIVSYDLPVGSYMLWAGTRAPEYFIEPTGQTLLRASYPELWQFAQDNNLVGKLFGEGDGQTTFTVNNLNDKDIKINNKIGDLTTINVGDANQLDYSRMKTINNGFVADKNGIVYTSGQIGNAVWWVKVNNKNVLVVGDNATGATYNTATVKLKKGDKIEGLISSSYFVPEYNPTSVHKVNLKIILKALPTPPTNAVPIGTILDYTGSSAPDGYIVANGAELSRTTFSKLYQWAIANGLVKAQGQIPATAHAFYGDGDGVSTFTIPDLRGVFRRNADLASNRGSVDVGLYQADGLPNITGTFGTGVMAPSGGYSGAFWENSVNEHTREGSSGYNGGKGHFDASRSNPIYGRANQVQPKSVSILPILKY